MDLDLRRGALVFSLHNLELPREIFFTSLHPEPQLCGGGNLYKVAWVLAEFVLTGVSFHRVSFYAWCQALDEFSTSAEVYKMKLTDFYNEVAKRTDTAKTSISAAETKRVLSQAFLVLAEMNAAELSDTLAKGLALAHKKNAP